MTSDVPEGTIRIRSKDLKPVIKTARSWKKANWNPTHARAVIDLFIAHDEFEFLFDHKDPRFLKGELSPDGKVKGARINILPTGEKLDKAYSLFASQLTINDETSHDHWDVIYKNPNGQYAYVYTQEKHLANKQAKFKKVDRFKRKFPTMQKEITKALSDPDDQMAIPMYTLMKTYMRIGNEMYFLANGHKGLTTLQKQDITINGNEVTFEYLAKDGVPRSITQEFPDEYVHRLSQQLGSLQNNSFVFTSPKGSHPLNDNHFKHAFVKYCGEEFYPHIIRSFYATQTLKDFLAKKKNPDKGEARALCFEVAHNLGHARYDKKQGHWIDSYTTTLNNYVPPKLAARMKEVMK